MAKNIDKSPLGLATDWFRPGLMPRPHRHNDVEINFLETGSLTYLFGGTRARVAAGQLAVFWATVPHQLIQVEDSAILHWLTIPFATFLRWQLPDILTQRIVRGNFALGASQGEEQTYQQLFRQWYNDLQQPAPELRRVVALEVEARLLRMALSLSLPTSSGHEDPSPQILSLQNNSQNAREQSPALQINAEFRAGQPEEEVYRPTIPDVPDASSTASVVDQAEAADDHLDIDELSPVERIASYVAEHYTEPLSVAQIAYVVSLHPNYAMSLFRKSYAISIGEYITQYRIAHAQRLLITTDLNVSQVAIESGFGSVSRFYTAFNAVCEQSPGEYRASLSLL